jgi:hypothetical protein
MSRRWLQFSLRGFLIVVTVFAVWLGWNVERARRRGRTIDAIVQGGGTVFYDEEGDDNDVFLHNLFDGEYTAHFWADLRRVPVDVSLDPDTRLDLSISQLLTEILPLSGLDFHYPVDENAWRYLRNLNDGCSIVVFDAHEAPPDELVRLEQAVPNLEVMWITAGK